MPNSKTAFTPAQLESIEDYSSHASKEAVEIAQLLEGEYQINDARRFFDRTRQSWLKHVEAFLDVDIERMIEAEPALRPEMLKKFRKTYERRDDQKSIIIAFLTLAIIVANQKLTGFQKEVDEYAFPIEVFMAYGAYSEEDDKKYDDFDGDFDENEETHDEDEDWDDEDEEGHDWDPDFY